MKKYPRRVKKILLIDPKGFGAGLSLGLGYLAGVLLKNKYQVKVLDFNNHASRLVKGPGFNLGLSSPLSWQERLDQALKWKPEVIGLTINSFTLDHALEIVTHCRQKTDPQVVYLAGGPHLNMFQKSFLEKYHYLFDFAFLGEGEITLPDLLKNLNQPQKVKGILYYEARKDEVIQTEPRPLIEDLNSLPFPDFKVFDTVSAKAGLHNYQMMSSRGCPFGCVFCFKMWGRKWRARSAENVLAEIKQAKKKYRPKTLTFWDDNFTLDLKRAKRICDLMISEKINLPYGLAGMRADLADEELICKLKESGCNNISMGIEDADPKTFPLVGKGESLKQIEKTVKLIQKYEIPLIGYMVTGLINHTYQSFLRSLEFIEKLGIAAHWSIAFPFPRTPLFVWVHQNGRFLMTLEQGFQQCMTSKNPPIVFDTPEYPAGQRLKAYYLGNLRSKSYDLLISSRSGNFFKQGFDILEIIWKYDRPNASWHFKNLLKLFYQTLK